MSEHYKFETLPTKSKKIIKIVFTGGPCAGKTTSMAFCADLLRDRGFQVYMVPEAATQIAMGGGMINMVSFDSQQQILFQSYLMKMQMNLEDRFSEIANIPNSDQPAVLLCDRGTMDGQAYVDGRTWQVLLDEMGFNQVQLRDNRYDAVIHLVTAANGAEQYYNLDNAARYESTLEKAIEIDEKLQAAWAGHPYWIKIDNKYEFDDKVKRVGQALLHLVEQPTSLTFYKKFLLTKNELNYQNINIEQVFEVEDTFLKRNPAYIERRIRRRGQNDSYIYLVFETRMFNNKPIETKRRIRSRDYMSLYEQRDLDRQTVKKTKKIFIWNKSVYNIEEFLIPGQQFTQCIIQTEENMNDQLPLPDFIRDNIAREITDDEQYTPSNLAVKSWVIPEEDLRHMWRK